MTPDLLVQLSQFGVAGLIGLLWILERRHAAKRDRQLDEVHRRLISRQQDSDSLLDVVKENTRAIAALESSQRELIGLLRLLTSAPTVPAAAVESSGRLGDSQCAG